VIVLEKLLTNNQAATLQDVQTADSEDAATRKLVAVIDGLAAVQCLKKPDWVKNCSQLANCVQKGRQEQKPLVVSRVLSV